MSEYSSWRGVKGHYHYPRSSKQTTAPSGPSLCHSPLLWSAEVTGAVVTKVSCTTDASVLGTLSSRGGEASYQYCNKQP